jgi:hypothetical protein
MCWVSTGIQCFFKFEKDSECFATSSLLGPSLVLSELWSFSGLKIMRVTCLCAVPMDRCVMMADSATNPGPVIQCSWMSREHSSSRVREMLHRCYAAARNHYSCAIVERGAEDGSTHFVQSDRSHAFAARVVHTRQCHVHERTSGTTDSHRNTVELLRRPL